MKSLDLVKKVTILCDCTDSGDLKESIFSHIIIDVDKGVKLLPVNSSPISARDKVYEALSKATKCEEPAVVVLNSLHELNALAVVVRNSQAEVKDDSIPTLDLSSTDILEAWEDKYISILKPDGLSSSYDEAMKPIVSDFLRLQAKQMPGEEESEVTQFLETKEGSSVEEVIESRKKQRHEEGI